MSNAIDTLGDVEVNPGPKKLSYLSFFHWNTIKHKRGGVCMFYKEYLPVSRHDDLYTLTECIVTEVNIGKKSTVFTCSYRSPSQTTDQFDVYNQNLNLILSNVDALSQICHILIGNFNSRSSNWWS